MLQSRDVSSANWPITAVVRMSTLKDAWYGRTNARTRLGSRMELPAATFLPRVSTVRLRAEPAARKCRR